MAKTALVLSGGGSKGAFQAGAERYLREIAGYKWDVISGVSVGALNGTLLAMKAFNRLQDLWKTIAPDDVYATGRLGKARITHRLLKGKSVYDNSALAKLVEHEVDLSQITDIDLRVGAVSLVSGEYEVFKPGDVGFKKALLASTSIPMIFPPVDVRAEWPAMVDGALCNYSPLGDVLDAAPDEIVAINCMPRRPSRLAAPPANALRVAQRAIEIATNRIFRSDVDKFLRINRLVGQVSAKACSDLQLLNSNGQIYRYIKLTLIEPDAELGGALDFSRPTLDRNMRLGFEKAQKVIESTPLPPP